MKKNEPFLRWAGGKRWLVPFINELLKNIEINHYFEPFLGGAAVFFNVSFSKKAYLSDLNQDLINTYIQVRDNVEELIDIVGTFKNEEKEYYRLRDVVFHTDVERAAQFIYLNQTSFNGLYRVNEQGRYNVPYGHRKNHEIEISRLLIANEKLQGTSIKNGDFEINKYLIGNKDLVFLDPPYTVSHNHNGFIEYNQSLFSLEDQYRLCKFIKYVKKKGAFYIMTNAAHCKIKEIFDLDDNRIEISRASLIGGKWAKRQTVKEYIFTNIPRGEAIDEKFRNKLGEDCIWR